MMVMVLHGLSSKSSRVHLIDRRSQSKGEGYSVLIITARAEVCTEYRAQTEATARNVGLPRGLVNPTRDSDRQESAWIKVAQARRSGGGESKKTVSSKDTQTIFQSSGDDVIIPKRGRNRGSNAIRSDQLRKRTQGEKETWGKRGWRSIRQYFLG